MICPKYHVVFTFHIIQHSIVWLSGGFSLTHLIKFNGWSSLIEPLNIEYWQLTTPCAPTTPIMFYHRMRTCQANGLLLFDNWNISQEILMMWMMKLFEYLMHIIVSDPNCFPKFLSFSNSINFNLNWNIFMDLEWI